MLDNLVFVGLGDLLTLLDCLLVVCFGRCLVYFVMMWAFDCLFFCLFGLVIWLWVGCFSYVVACLLLRLI